MRKKIIAGNWKMNKTVNEGLLLAQQLRDFLSNHRGSAEVIICPPFTHLHAINESVKGSRLKTGAQNCSFEESGAYTGEVSAAMISSLGSEYTIIGHSERRSIFNEGNSILKKKVDIALKNGLKVIFCCGEVLAERENGKHFDVVKTQLTEGIFSLPSSDFGSIVIAYEPVWAIGTGKTASSDQAQEMHAYIRKLLQENYNRDIAESTSILYGGSCNPGNAAELFSMKDVDGGLVGGASLKADDFCSIIKLI